MTHPTTRTARGESIQLAVCQLLELSAFCDDNELLSIFTVIANVHGRYSDQIETMRREQRALAQAAAHERAERGKQQRR
jgi:hypothetical protein